MDRIQYRFYAIGRVVDNYYLYVNTYCYQNINYKVKTINIFKVMLESLVSSTVDYFHKLFTTTST